VLIRPNFGKSFPRFGIFIQRRSWDKLNVGGGETPVRGGQIAISLPFVTKAEADFGHFKFTRSKFAVFHG
jgi:hypothetical protein